eukprot:364277-Chlamydomonas_euryale.AAC.18
MGAGHARPVRRHGSWARPPCAAPWELGTSALCGAMGAGYARPVRRHGSWARPPCAAPWELGTSALCGAMGNGQTLRRRRGVLFWQFGRICIP